MEMGCPLGLAEMGHSKDDGHVGEVPLKVCHPSAIHPLILGPKLGLAFWGGIGGIILPAEVIVGAILQDGFIGQLPLALGEGAVASVPFAVPCLYLPILAPLLGIDDPRTSKRIDFIGGIRGTGELERLVGAGTGVVAFSMYPTTVEQLMDIADAGAIMPPKSTWFEPKLRDGLVTHSF